MSMLDRSEQTAIGEVIDRLAQKYPTVPPEMVNSVVQDAHAKFEGRPIRDFVPIFVERSAGTELSKRSG